MKFIPELLPPWRVSPCTENSYEAQLDYAEEFEDSHRIDDRNAQAVAIAAGLDAADWRDVVSAASRGVCLDTNEYMEDGVSTLPILSRLAYTMTWTDPWGNNDPIAVMDKRGLPIDTVRGILTAVEEVIALDPDLPWKLVAAWAGLPEGYDSSGWISTGTRTA